VGPVVDELLLKQLPLLVELSSPQRLGHRTWSTSKRFLESASLQLGNVAFTIVPQRSSSCILSDVGIRC